MVEPDVKLPLAIREVAPGPQFTRLEAVRWDGLSEGVHTGGAWLSPDGKEVWKPCDGRPYMNADAHYTTHEVACLEAMAGQVGFPRNWRVEAAGSIDTPEGVLTRQWIVRKRAWVWGVEQASYTERRISFSTVAFEDVLRIEYAMRALFRAGWQLNDKIVVAQDADTSEPFIVDCSIASPRSRIPDYWTEDYLVDQLMRACGMERLALLRHLGRDIAVDLALIHKYGDEYFGGNVYASRNRPMSKLWATNGLEAARFVEGDYGRTGVWSWVITPRNAPLPAEVLYRYELEWAWSDARAEPAPTWGEA